MEDPRQRLTRLMSEAGEGDDAWERLSNEDARAAEVVKLRFFDGLEVGEVAQALELSPRTLARELAYGRAKLAAWLGAGEASDLGPESPA